MSRPSTSNVQRPSGGQVANNRPSMGTLPTPGKGSGNKAGAGNVANRPSAATRPSTGNVANRPNVGNQPGAGARPGASAGAVAGARPAAGTRPSTRDVQNFLDVPNAGGGNVAGGRPSSGVGNAAAIAGGALAGGAAAEFLQDRPSDAGVSGQPGNRVDAGLAGQPGNRVDAGLPGQPGNRVDAGLPGQPGNRVDAGLRGQPGNRVDAGLPGQPGNRVDAGLPGRPGDRAQALPGRIADSGQWQNWRQENLGNVRDYWQNNLGDHGDWYGGSWWNDNHINYPYAPGFGIWAGAAWSGLSNWGNYGWTEPIYYNYGDNVYYEDGSVYYGDQPVCTEQQYIDQAEAIALSAPEVQPAAKDWMPLGVFAITQDGEPTGAEPTMFLQLALSKQGVISGTFQNTATNTVKAVEGMVDKQSQRAAWTAEGQSRPLMETGIGNLTQDTATVLVHFPDNTTQQALLVRLEQPEGTKK